MPGRAEVTAFNGLRAVAAWWVVLYHFDGIVPLGGAIGALARQGYRAVDLFFIMSGFVIALRYDEAFRAGVSLRRWAWFMAMRLARIYPLHLAIMLLYVSVPLATLATGRPLPDLRFLPSYFVKTLLLIQDWGVTGLFSWNLPSWSISAEFAFYLLFPFAAAALTPVLAHRRGVVLAGLAILACILLVGSLYGSFVFRTARYGVVRCISECILGMWLRHAVALWPPGPKASRLLITASALLAALYATGTAPDFTVLPAAYVFLLAALTRRQTWAASVLSHPVLAYLGAISFSTYMIHYLVKDWTKLLVVGRVPNAVVALVYAAAVLVASALLYRLVETPGRRYGRRLAARIVAPPVAQTA